ncbi:hypothetical protein GCM10009827_115370 [Dactylosporangium maewongense]|uniref:Uncharacterized protein n=1 Tax=Dactylosporangium maewongense TaxID=634393 RepID=A0ABN2DBU7_9ACTN
MGLLAGDPFGTAVGHTGAFDVELLRRILYLTTDDLAIVDGELQLRLGEPPSPVPAPFAGLPNQLAAASARSGTSLPFLSGLSEVGRLSTK